MATGIYKNGVAIIVTYQAVNCATGKTVTMDVYDEAHAKDEAKCVAEMTEVAATGRYYATFTPDAEGEWIIVMKNTTDGNGEVVKAFAVAGHDVDEIGDNLATVDGKIDTVDTVVDGIQTDLDNETDGLGALKTLIDGKASSGEYDTELDQNLSTTESNIRGADSDTLKTLSDQIDAVSSPAMVG